MCSIKEDPNILFSQCDDGKIYSYDVRNLGQNLSSFSVGSIYKTTRHYNTIGNTLSKIVADKTKVVWSPSFLLANTSYPYMGPHVLQHMNGVFNIREGNQEVSIGKPRASFKGVQPAGSVDTVSHQIVDFDFSGDTLAVATRSELDYVGGGRIPYWFNCGLLGSRFYGERFALGELFLYDLTRLDNERQDTYKKMALNHRSLTSQIQKEKVRSGEYSGEE